MRTYRLLLLLLLLSLVLPACGGAAQLSAAPTTAAEPATAPAAAPSEAPQAEPTSPPAPEPTEAPAAEPTTQPDATEPAGSGGEEAAHTVRIGVLNPTTGSFTSFGKDVNTGIELFFNSIDRKVGNTSVELVFADTAGDPQQALEQARRLVEQEKVDFLMGIVNSAVVVPVAQFADEQQVPLLILVGGARAATGPDRSPYVFRTAMANGQQDRPLGWYTASTLGLKRAATFAWDFLVGEERAGAFASTFTAAGGTIVAQQKPPLGTTDYGPFISQVDPSSIDVAYAFFAGPGAISFVQQMRQFGLTPKLQLVAADYFTAGVLGEMGENAAGLVQGSQYTPELQNAENETFLKLYEAEVGGEPGVYVEEGYLGAAVAAAAIEAVGGDLSDKQAFLEALASLELETPSGPFRFDERGQSVRNVYITRVVASGGAVAREILDTIEGVSQEWMP